MTSPPRICVVGSANVDLTFRTPRLPRPGETLAGTAFHLDMGGKGANQAVAAARLGAHVAFLARVGNDAFGQEALARYQADGIDTSYVQKDANLPTGTAAILVDDDAENCIIVVPGANGGLSPEDVRTFRALEKAALVLCQLEVPLETVLEAFRIARFHGVRTVLTPAPARELPDELLRLCDFCVPNKTELELLTGRKVDNQDDALLAAGILRQRGAGAVIVTMGRGGALLVGDSDATHIPAVSVKAVDPTGAGDAFTAALAVSLAQGLGLAEAARLSSLVAGLTVTRVGAQAAFPTLAEVDNWQTAVN